MKSAVNWQVNALVEATPISGPGVRIDGARGLARDHGADHIADGQRLDPFRFRLALRGQRVRRFAGLRDDHGERVLGDDRIAIAELAAVIHFHRKARQPLDHELAGQPGVPAGAAGDDADLANARELGRRDVHLVEEDAAGLLPDAPQRGVAHGARLLEDLLEHEVLVAALFRLDRVPENMRDLPVDGTAIEVASA